MRNRRIPAETVNHERWMVSYSDLVTLLFAFFVVLFAAAHRDSQSIRQVSFSIQSGFRNMSAFAADAQQNAAAVRGTGGLNVSPAPLGSKTPPAASPGNLSPEEMMALRQQLQSAMGAELQNHEVDMRVTPAGFVISLKELGFFNSAEAALMPGAAQKIKRIGTILSQRHLDVRIEGHSDNQPIHNAQFQSNWELSTARAMTVLSILRDDAGYDPSNLSVSGYGQYHPLADNGTPEGRRMNRRVDLVVQSTVAESRLK